MHVIPKIVSSLDVETGGAGENAYIASISLASWVVKDLSFLGYSDYLIGFEDSMQANRQREDRVMDWWRGLGEDSPDRRAYEVLKNARGNLMDGLQMLDNYLYRMNKDHGLQLGEHVLFCKGPDFDPVIIQNARKQLAVRFYMPARMLDSSRTAERVETCLQMPAVDRVKLGKVSPYNEIIDHVSVCDAIFESFQGARMYNTLMALSGAGLDEYMMVAPHEKD